MSSSAGIRPTRKRTIRVSIAYGSADVEQAADSLDVSLSDEETEAILANIDSELPEIAAIATRSALAGRIYEDLSHVARGHAWSDDD